MVVLGSKSEDHTACLVQLPETNIGYEPSISVSDLALGSLGSFQAAVLLLVNVCWQTGGCSSKELDISLDQSSGPLKRDTYMGSRLYSSTMAVQ
jgi:hypothetical protein